MNTKQRLINKLAELKAAIAETELEIEKEAEKPREVNSQRYIIQGNLDHKLPTHNSCMGYAEAGSVVSEKNLERVIRERREAQVLGCIIREENELTDFVADWDDVSQIKFYLYFSAPYNRYYSCAVSDVYLAGVEYCDKETAIKLQELLNKGAGIKGVRSGS